MLNVSAANILNQDSLLILINTAFILLILIGLFFITKKFINKNESVNHFISITYKAIKWPLLSLLVIYGLFFTVQYLENLYPNLASSNKFHLLPYLLNSLGIISFFWLGYDLLYLAKEKLISWAARTQHITILNILPAISESVNAAFILIMCNLIVPYLGLAGIGNMVAEKILKVLLIMTLGWISFKIVFILENIIMHQHKPDNSTVIAMRKLKTQIIILRRILLSLIVIITAATILMTFDSVRNLGTGILTTAGLLSAIAAFASQQSLSRIFSGLQLAFSQPIRIGDTIVIDEEFGQVEEINLSYVTVKLWDLRRLIKPTDYFTKNGVLNLTRESTQLLGTVMLYCDYTLPVNLLRDKFKSLVQRSSFWDKNVAELDVTDITDKCMQIRLLMSAENADLLWKLRCEIREKVMAYLAEEHPDRLARARNVAIPAPQIRELAKAN